MILLNAKAPGRKSSLLFTIGKVLLGITLFLIVLFFYAKTFNVAKVTGFSMMPAVANGDRVMMQKRFSLPKVGEIHGVIGIRHKYSKNGISTKLLKRVIAGPGDTLTFYAATGEWLSINGQAVELIPHVDEEKLHIISRNGPSKGGKGALVKHTNMYLGLAMYRIDVNSFNNTEKGRLFREGLHIYTYLTDQAGKNGITEVVLPEHHYFVMSDNWSGNMDSRFFGPVHKDHLDSRMVKVLNKDESDN